jgi:hypothetical protein
MLETKIKIVYTTQLQSVVPQTDIPVCLPPSFPIRVLQVRWDTGSIIEDIRASA